MDQYGKFGKAVDEAKVWLASEGSGCGRVRPEWPGPTFGFNPRGFRSYQEALCGFMRLS